MCMCVWWLLLLLLLLLPLLALEDKVIAFLR
jgi:hypothetical protein